AAWPAGYFAAFATAAALTKPGAPFAGQEVLAARIALGLVGSTIGTLLVIGALALAARTWPSTTTVLRTLFVAGIVAVLSVVPSEANPAQMNILMPLLLPVWQAVVLFSA
ncbi:hypothetical protein J8J27_24665, partial [Mycobacterium tuberculosis]|nr:hypothetical protein [Mycobacterium tuberculosis]